MRVLRYCLRSINLLNLLLAAAAASLAVYALFPLANVKATFKPPAAEQAAAAQEEKPAATQSPSPAEYAVVADQNLFHPERKIPPEKTAESQVKPDLILYGTLLGDNMRLAYIEDLKSPKSTPGRGKRQTVVKQGDTLSGFLLKSVETDRIVLVRGDEQMTVYLTDARKTRGPATSPQPAAPQAGVRPGAPGGTPAVSAVPAAGPAAPGVPSRASDRVTAGRQARSELISQRAAAGTTAPAAPQGAAASPSVPGAQPPATGR
jgi:hypothetical protein